MLEFQSFSPSDNGGDHSVSQQNDSCQRSCQYSQAPHPRQVAEPGSMVMSDRGWASLQEEQESQQQGQERQQPPPAPIALPLVQVQQQHPPYSSVTVPAHLQAAASVYPYPSIYMGIDPALAAGHYHYSQSYGTTSAFRFPPPQEHLQHDQPLVPTAGFGFGRPSFIGEVPGGPAVRASSYERPKLTQLGRTFSSPEKPTPPPTMTPVAFSAPASASLFPPPSGQPSYSLHAVERATSSGAVHSFFDPYHASVSELLLQHHQHQQQQYLGSPSPSASEGHSPSMLAGIGGQAASLLSPFGETAFVFQPHPSSPSSHGQGQAPQAQPAVAGQHQLVCAVCGDTAACLHYGVRTCEGCKGFFKRTVQKNAKYVCLGNRDCVVDKRRRNRCQYCRFQKCLNVGMVKEVVRMDTLKGRRGRLPSKSKIAGSGEEAGASGSGGFVVAQSLTKALVNAYTGNGSAHLSVTTVRLGRSEQFIDSLRVSVQTTYQYAERIPGWTTLADQDRLRLLKRFCVHTLSLRWAHRSMAVAADGKLLSDDGLVYTLEECPLAWQTWFQSILNLSIHFRCSLELDITSFSCLCALSLVFQDCGELRRVEEVDKLKNNIINCLKEHCAYSMEAKAKPQYFARILSVLTDLNTISQYARQAYAATFGDTASMEDRPSTSASTPLSLTFFDESFLD